MTPGVALPNDRYVVTQNNGLLTDDEFSDWLALHTPGSNVPLTEGTEKNETEGGGLMDSQEGEAPKEKGSEEYLSLLGTMFSIPERNSWKHLSDKIAKKNRYLTDIDHLNRRFFMQEDPVFRGNYQSQRGLDGEGILSSDNGWHPIQNPIKGHPIETKHGMQADVGRQIPSFDVLPFERVERTEQEASLPMNQKLLINGEDRPHIFHSRPLLEWNQQEKTTVNQYFQPELARSSEDLIVEKEKEPNGHFHPDFRSFDDQYNSRFYSIKPSIGSKDHIEAALEQVKRDDQWLLAHVQGRADSSYERLGVGADPLTGNQSLGIDHQNRIEKYAQLLIDQGGGRARVRLHPEELGEVDLKVQVVGNRVRIEIVTENQASREIIDQSLSNLRENLEKAQLKLERAEVLIDEKVMGTAVSSSKSGPEISPHIPEHPMNHSMLRDMLHEQRQNAFARQSQILQDWHMERESAQRPSVDPLRPAEVTRNSVPRYVGQHKGRSLNLVG